MHIARSILSADFRNRFILSTSSRKILMRASCQNGKTEQIGYSARPPKDKTPTLVFSITLLFFEINSPKDMQKSLLIFTVFYADLPYRAGYFPNSGKLERFRSPQFPNFLKEINTSFFNSMNRFYKSVKLTIIDRKQLSFFLFSLEILRKSRTLLVAPVYSLHNGATNSR